MAWKNGWKLQLFIFNKTKRLLLLYISSHFARSTLIIFLLYDITKKKCCWNVAVTLEPANQGYSYIKSIFKNSAIHIKILYYCCHIAWFNSDSMVSIIVTWLFWPILRGKLVHFCHSYNIFFTKWDDICTKKTCCLFEKK